MLSAEPAPKEAPAAGADSGLQCLVLIARFHGVAADPEQLRHALAVGPPGLGTAGIVRGARELGFKAKAVRVPYGRLPKLTLPAVAAERGGGFVILAKADEGQVLLLDPAEPTPRLLPRAEFVQRWAGTVVLFRPQGAAASEPRFGLAWFLPAIGKYRRALGEALLASLMLQVFGLVTPLFTQVVIDKVLVHRALGTLDVLIVGLAAIAVFEAVLGIARTFVFAHTTSKIDVALGARLFRHLLRLPLRYFEVRRVGDTVARVRELETIRQFLTGAPLTAVLDVAFVAVFVAVMFFYSTTLTLVALAALPCYAALSALTIPILRRRLDERFDRGAESQAYLVEAVSGIQTVKALALEPESQKRWETLLARYVRASLGTATVAGAAGAVGQLISRASYLVVLWFGAHLVIEARLTVGELIAFQMLAARVSEPVLRLVRLWQDFQQAGLSIRRLADIFHTQPEPAVNPARARLPAIRGEVRFEGVRFRYRPDGPEVIRNVTFALEAGTAVGIVGRSGSGKTTLSKLIQRLYVPEGGKVLIDGVDLALADPAWLRRQVGVVLQESFLFNGSVRDNVAAQAPSAPMTEVVRVAKIAGAHDFILELAEGYDTPVGEKGVALSGGQRQRIAIARALLTDPKLLIFDEATSALDYESERQIQENMAAICRGRTVLLVAHRLSSLRHVQRILVLDRGELVEEGPHEELLSRDGLYRYLWGQQGREAA